MYIQTTQPFSARPILCIVNDNLTSLPTKQRQWRGLRKTAHKVITEYLYRYIASDISIYIYMHIHIVIIYDCILSEYYMMMMFSARGANMRLIYVTVHLQLPRLSRASSGPACDFEDVILWCGGEPRHYSPVFHPIQRLCSAFLSQYRAGAS